MGAVRPGCARWCRRGCVTRPMRLCGRGRVHPRLPGACPCARRGGIVVQGRRCRRHCTSPGER
eukprot:999699-Rhodomonas_salina.1